MQVSKIIAILLVLFAIMFGHSMDIYVRFYYQFYFCTLVFLLTISLYILLPSEYKNICIALLLIYKRNFSIFVGTFHNIVKKGFLEDVSERKNNDDLKELVKRIYNDNFKLHIDFSQMSLDKPCIIVVNYCNDRMENLASMLVPGDISIMMRDTIGSVLGRIVKWTVPTKENRCYNETKDAVCQSIQNGRSVLTYATVYNGFRPDYIHRIRSGVFSIAKDGNIPMTLLCVDHIDFGMLGHIPYQNFRIKTSKTFYVEDVRASMHYARLFFKETIQEFIRIKYEDI